MEWIILLLAILAIYLLALPLSFRAPPPSFRAASGLEFRSALHGRAWVTDGDGVRVNNVTVRLAGLDAPEHDQQALLFNGSTIPHGRIVKSALIRKLGGRTVHVETEGTDKFGRCLGTIHCDGEDINRWLVAEGHAIAAYGDRYRDAEYHARAYRKGMWRFKTAYHPGAWRHGERRRLRSR